MFATELEFVADFICAMDLAPMDPLAAASVFRLFVPNRRAGGGASSNGDGRQSPLPVDPLFTDQREIRLSFMKVTLVTN